MHKTQTVPKRFLVGGKAKLALQYLRTCMLRASICLLVLAVFWPATSAAQDPIESAGKDHAGASKRAQPQPSQARTPGTAPAEPDGRSNLACTEQSAVSELECIEPRRTGSSEAPQLGARLLGPAIGTLTGGHMPATTDPGPASVGGGFWQTEPRSIFGTDPGMSSLYRRPDSGDLRNLSGQADNPMASIASFTFETSYSSSLWGMKGAPTQIQTIYRPAIPFSFFGTSSILRVSLPYGAASGGRMDSGNVEVMDLLAVSNKWGRWGAGAVATFGASTGFTIDTFRAGPAVGFVSKQGSWLLGALNKNLFSENAAVSSIQPIIAYQLARGWSVGAGELEYRIDWNRSGFAQVPVGFQIGKVMENGSRYFRFFVSPQYNLRNNYGATRWTVTMGVSILSPGE